MLQQQFEHAIIVGGSLGGLMMGLALSMFWLCSDYS